MFGSRGSRSAALAACAALLLGMATACESEQPKEPATRPVRLYGTDGNMQNNFAREFSKPAGLLDGMKGTTPQTPLSDDFKSRLRSVDPKLDDFLYTGEMYDAIVITALAAQLAGSTEPGEIAKQIVGVTNTGARCSSVAVCLQQARSGLDIEYRGVSITRGGLTDVGEPSTATYATLHFDGNGLLNPSKTEFVGAGDESAASTAVPPKPRTAVNTASSRTAGGPLKLGGLLSRTGALSLGYPAMAAASTLAIREVNAAGGVLGRPVVWIAGDDGTDPATAKAVVARHIAQGVQVVIAGGASGIARAVLPDVLAAGLVLFSPSNTDAGLSTIEDQGRYFRTAPSDLLQGRALADVILRDGPSRIAIVARRDPYGEGLQGHVRSELERAGISGDRIRLLTYEVPTSGPGTRIDFTAGAREIQKAGVDAVLVIGYGESAQAIEALVDAGVRLGH